MTARAAQSRRSGTTRRDILAAAIAVPAATLAPDLPAPAFAEDTKVVAAGAKFERILFEFFEATLEWAPRLTAASRTAAARFGLSRHDYGIAARRDFSSALFEEFARNGGTSASQRMSALERRLTPLARIIVASRDTSTAALRAKVLVVLFETRPTSADVLDCWSFPDDRGATRALFDTTAALVGLSSLLASIEARFAATAAEIAAKDAAFCV